MTQPLVDQNILNSLNLETTYVQNPVASHFSHDDSIYLLNNYRTSDRSRHRLCYHQNPNVKLHDIIICYDKTSYIPPNKHINKPESLCILQGSVKLYFFNDSGDLFSTLILSASDSKSTSIIRIPPNTWHGLRVLDDQPVIMKETILGPYDRSSLQWAPFAPSEHENKLNNSGFSFYHKLDADSANTSLVPLSFVEASSNVLYSSNQIPFVNNEILDLVTDLANKSELKRARFCLHPNGDDSQQDMVIYLAPGCNIPPSYHINKDESLVVLKGSGRYDFLNQDGSVRSSITLSPFNQIDSSSSSFVRINRFVLHQITVGDEGLLIYESTSGPFHKNDTSYFSS